MDWVTSPQILERVGRPWHPGQVTAPPDADAAEPLRFECPRCGTAAAEAYYGPCERCRNDLRAALGGEHRDAEAAAYEPKVNVTPNAVATKD